MSNSLGTLTLDLIAKIGGFTAPLTEAERKAKSSMKGISNAAKDGGKSIETMGKVADVAKLAIVGVVTAAATLGTTKLIEVQRQFDVLNAGLVTATGSSEKAGEAFKVLQQFAATTPYTLNQAVEGFTKLVNLGLDPSERALRSYGNTSAAMGKDLMQMVEAVADAATGEFERLKEFGIKARVQGDSVALSFQGTTTKVKNNAAAIEEYLIALGENKFGDAMALRSKTLDGAISNLGDSWDNLFLTISNSGIGDSIKEAVLSVTDGITGLTSAFESGEIPTLLAGFGDAFGLFSDDAVGDVKSIVGAIGSMMSAIGLGRDSVIADLNAMGNAWNDFKTLVQKSSAFVAAAAQTIATGKDQNQQLALTLDYYDDINSKKHDSLAFANQEAKAQAAMSEILKGMGGGKKDNSILGQYKKVGTPSQSSSDAKKAEDELKKAQSQFKSLQDLASTETEKANKSLDERLKLIGRFATKGSAEYTKLYDWAIKENKRSLLEEEISHDAAVNEFRDMVGTRIEIMKNEAAARTKGIFANPILSESEKKEAVSRLGDFYQNKQDLMELSDRKEIAGFYENNRTQLENIRQKYAFEREEIQKNLDLSDPDRQKRLKGLANQEGGDIQKLQESATSGFFGLQSSLSGDDENYRLSQQKEERYKIIQDALDAEAVQQEQANALRFQVDQDYATQKEALDRAHFGTVLDSTTQMFGQLFGEQSGAYRVMFAASKAFAIAQSIIAIQGAIASASFSLPFPANLGAMAIIAAQTASIVSTIASVTMPTGQAHDGIDYVPKEGTWLLDKGERVLSPRQNADFTKMMQNDKGMNAMRQNSQMQQMMPSSNNVSMSNKIINLIDPNLLGDYLKTNAGERVLVNTISRARSQVNQVLQ